MKLKNQVASLELSKKLKELGFKQDSLWYWSKSFDVNEKFTGEAARIECIDWIMYCDMEDAIVCSAFTVAELGEMLKHLKNYTPKYYDYRWRGVIKNVSFSEETEADARAKMLIYLKENGLL